MYTAVGSPVGLGVPPGSWIAVTEHLSSDVRE